MKKLIVTADDFGMSIHVNEAIEEAHRGGILTTASLMVGGKAAADAIDRARRLPSLRVGLHLVLVDGPSVLPATAIPHLLDTKQNLPPHLAKAGIRFFFSAKTRQQLEAEIRAQFRSFQATGLSLDHVNAHHHMHLHPTVSGILLKVGKEYGLRAARLPYEPPILSWQASRKALFRRVRASFFLCPWIALLKKRMARKGIGSNDFVFGMYDSGTMRLDLVLRFLQVLPDGVTEIYFHPIKQVLGQNPSSEELKTLVSPELRQASNALGIERITFSQL